jgi:hypothetical protein
MRVKTLSISMDEVISQQASVEAARSGAGSLSAWVTRAVREKLQRDGALAVAEADQRTGNAWAEWVEAAAFDPRDPRDPRDPEAGQGAG